jgi:uncharacterized protein (DUF1800 family)
MATNAASGSGAGAVVAATAVAATAAAVLATSQGGILSNGAAGDPTAEDYAAARFLGQASFGANDAGIADVKQNKPAGWIKAQAAVSYSPTAFLDWWVARDAAINAADTNHKAHANAGQFQEAFWSAAVTGADQLRLRMAFALSEIFVISFQGSQITPRIGAAYYDMLRTRAFGNYRDLLEAVTLSPGMGMFLNIIGNNQADNDPTRHPDENYAREIMQLMSIGLFALDASGTPNLNKPTYSHDDIAGLAKIFTGWGWYAAKPTEASFTRPTETGADVRPLIGYPNHHSQLAKTFLGVTFPAYGAWTAPSGVAKTLAAYQQAGLKFALDTIFHHPNVGPFIGRRLIQRFVKSNPSSAYIARVAAAFNNNGAGVRGDLLATLTAVLTDSEATSPGTGAFDGKLREPVLRLANWLRAFEAKSASGNFLQPGDLNQPTALDQAPLESATVFNFFQPDYAPPGTDIATAGKVAPEFQAVDVLTAASYANRALGVVQAGNWGNSDVTTGYAKELALADPTTKLVDGARLARRLDMLICGGRMSDGLARRIVDVVSSITPTAKTPTAAQLAAANLDRVRSAVALTMVSTDYLIQR